MTEEVTRPDQSAWPRRAFRIRRADVGKTPASTHGRLAAVRVAGVPQVVMAEDKDPNTLGSTAR